MDVDLKEEGKELNSKSRYTEATSDDQIWSIETNHQILASQRDSFGRFASSEKKANRNQVAIVENHQL